MAQIQKLYPQALLLNVGDAEIDWERFNLNGDRCHPSPYGYDQIARYVAEHLNRHALPEPTN